MCGIAGIVSENPAHISKQLLRNMTDAIAHRGPDGEGVVLDDNNRLALAHRRLAILDLQIGGAATALSQRHQILVGEADAAVRASSVDAKVVSGHLPAPENNDAPARRARTIMRLMPGRKWFVQSISGLCRLLSQPCPATNADVLR